jgi:hypothetical protein
MSYWETASLVYLAAGLTCWLVLTVADLRIGRRTSELSAAATKVAIALPVIVFWPFLILALIRSERVDRRSGSVAVKHEEPSQARPDRVEGR